MLPGTKKLVIRSFSFYKRSSIYQLLIISLLSAIITGSLLTGSSVRESLKKTVIQHLGSTNILVSSGSRYFDKALAERIRESADLDCTGLLEMTGFCQNLSTQQAARNISIWAVPEGIFTYGLSDTIRIAPGMVAVNEKIANDLSLKAGDDLIIRFREITDIPADAPFAPGREEGKSVVLKVIRILRPASSGNFSLSISQMVPENVFVNIEDIRSGKDSSAKINRLLIMKNNNIRTNDVLKILKGKMTLSDIGLKIIEIGKTGECELRSDRVFLDNSLIHEVQNIIPSAAPLLTYLGNRFSAGGAYTPYSFISALPQSLYPEITAGNSIIINKWMADDLMVKKGEPLDVSWYAPDSLNRLIIKKDRFTVTDIVEMKGIWADSLLMPEFPGISGSETCSGWDAGVPVSLNDIRKKDEDYWKRYRGTPKAFINYDKGKEIWGSNFGQATAMRFPGNLSEKQIIGKLAGNLDPEKNGFTITDIYRESMRAADESTDFSTLFISLSIFLIIAAIVLLSLAITSYLESKREQIRAYFALGFKSSWIKRLLISESGIIALSGCLLGSAAGIIVNIIIISLLNGAWSGAVQTHTLGAYVRLVPVVSGFIISMAGAVLIMLIKVRLHLRNLNRNKKVIHTPESHKNNLIFLLFSLLISLILFTLSFVFKKYEIMLCFASGSLLLISLILIWRQYFTGSERSGSGLLQEKRLSRLYYSFYPSHAVTPILFIATGIFAVVITGANRLNFSMDHLNHSGGTGGYLLWCDNTIPIREDLTTRKGRESLGLNDPQTVLMNFVQLKRYAGNDASCLNLNHIRIPPVLGVDVSDFITREAFSFATALKRNGINNPWEFLKTTNSGNTIYGIADQTVLEWGLKVKTGDTLMIRSENGQKLNIIIAGGLKSSVFQGYVLIGMEDFRKFFPSVSGTSIMLVSGDKELIKPYSSILNERLVNYGTKVEETGERLSSFYAVTNTYLDVFGAFGALGMISGVAGVGFILLRNFSYRKREYALMLSAGFTVRKIRNLIASDHILIILAGIISGSLPALIATFPSFKSNYNIPWFYLITMIFAIAVTGMAAIGISLKSVTSESLIASLKKD